jgi:hypothetical protein
MDEDVIHFEVSQILESPRTAVGLVSDGEKFRPITLRLAPPVVTIFTELKSVTTGASNVKRLFPTVPTTAAIVSRILTALPCPGGAVHESDVSLPHTVVVHIVLPSSAVGVWLIRPKFKPCMVKSAGVAA